MYIGEVINETSETITVRISAVGLDECLFLCSPHNIRTRVGNVVLFDGIVSATNKKNVFVMS